MTHNDTVSLPPVVAGHIDAVNAHDEDAIVATFADCALVNDAHRSLDAHLADLAPHLPANATLPRLAVRTGDTPAAERRWLREDPPDVLLKVIVPNCGYGISNCATVIVSPARLLGTGISPLKGLAIRAFKRAPRPNDRYCRPPFDSGS